jgi:DNA-directed RNA polymerase subunit RPC12/RpoP
MEKQHNCVPNREVKMLKTAYKCLRCGTRFVFATTPDSKRRIITNCPKATCKSTNISQIESISTDKRVPNFGGGVFIGTANADS